MEKTFLIVKVIIKAIRKSNCHKKIMFDFFWRAWFNAKFLDKIW